MTTEKAIQSALIFHEKKDFEQALAIYQTIIDKDPDHFQALNLIGLANQQLGRERDALNAFERALKANPHHPLTHSGAGASALKLGQNALALEHLNNALNLAPRDTQALINKGIALHKLGSLHQAREAYLQAISINSQLAPAYYNLGCALQELKLNGSLEESIDRFITSIILEPQNASYYNNLGNSLKEKQLYAKAIKAFERALVINPTQAITYYNMGTTQFFAGDYHGATKTLGESVKLDPLCSKCWNNLGNALKECTKYEEALEAYQKALNLISNESDCEIIYNTGIVLHELGRYEQACEIYSRALAIAPKHTRALNARAITYRHLKLFQLAVLDFKAVLAIDPNFEYALGNLLHTQMHIADWSDWDMYVEDTTQTLAAKILNGQLVSHPFPVLALYDNPALNLKASRVWFEDKHAVPSTNLIADQFILGSGPLLNSNSHARLKPQSSEGHLDNKTNTRIKVAYLSADFHNHATAYLIAELFELHDRDTFEVYALSFGPTTNDVMHNRIRSGVEHFIDVKHLSDEAVASYCKSLRIDIAIDLKGYTLQSRFNIFMNRCAPIQAAYLGYPGTSGASCIDYLIADEICISREEEHFYSEKIVYLPNSYQVNDAKRSIKVNLQTKADLGLPKEGFVFCCFNNTYKIGPQTFKNWMRILKQVDNSVLWLLEDSELITANLRQAAKLHSIDPERLIFAKRITLDEHLGRHSHADLFLDTLPYNAHTTASDALWAGLPVLTLKGKSFAARVAASLLCAVDLRELITESTQAYIEKAVYLAHHPSELADLKSKLKTNKLSSPLFNTKRFTAHLETAYQIMVDRHRSNSKLDRIVIATD